MDNRGLKYRQPRAPDLRRFAAQGGGLAEEGLLGQGAKARGALG
jgi:hypothetical protein